MVFIFCRPLMSGAGTLCAQRLVFRTFFWNILDTFLCQERSFAGAEYVAYLRICRRKGRLILTTIVATWDAATLDLQVNLSWFDGGSMMWRFNENEIHDISKWLVTWLIWLFVFVSPLFSLFFDASTSFHRFCLAGAVHSPRYSAWPKNAGLASDGHVKTRRCWFEWDRWIVGVYCRSLRSIGAFVVSPEVFFLGNNLWKTSTVHETQTGMIMQMQTSVCYTYVCPAYAEYVCSCISCNVFFFCQRQGSVVVPTTELRLY